MPVPKRGYKNRIRVNLSSTEKEIKKERKNERMTPERRISINRISYAIESLVHYISQMVIFASPMVFDSLAI